MTVSVRWKPSSNCTPTTPRRRRREDELSFALRLRDSPCSQDPYEGGQLRPLRLAAGLCQWVTRVSSHEAYRPYRARPRTDEAKGEAMSAYTDTCPQCGREFRNSDVQRLRFCSIGCWSDWNNDVPREETAQTCTTPWSRSATSSERRWRTSSGNSTTLLGEGSDDRLATEGDSGALYRLFRRRVAPYSPRARGRPLPPRAHREAGGGGRSGAGIPRRPGFYRGRPDQSPRGARQMTPYRQDFSHMTAVCRENTIRYYKWQAQSNPDFLHLVKYYETGYMSDWLLERYHEQASVR